jgi:hypothetical protein
MGKIKRLLCNKKDYGCDVLLNFLALNGVGVDIKYCSTKAQTQPMQIFVGLISEKACA